jgi:adenylate kinase
VNILLLGPQGSGKGTQAKRISAEVGVPHISTGDMFREAIALQTDLGRRVEPILEAGRLVPDELTIALIRDRLGRGDALRGFVLDGFPRNLAQAEALDRMLEEEGRQLDVVFELQVSDAVARERLLNRAVLENRPDDTPEAIDRRLALYHEHTLPISEHYRARGILVGIHGERTPDEVFREIQQALRTLEARA